MPIDVLGGEGRNANIAASPGGFAEFAFKCRRVDKEQPMRSHIENGLQSPSVIVMPMRQDDTIGACQVKSKLLGVLQHQPRLPGVEEDRSTAAFDQKRKAVFHGQSGGTHDIIN